MNIAKRTSIEFNGYLVPLRPREIMAIRMIAEGKSRKEVAENLRIKAPTSRMMLQRIAEIIREKANFRINGSNDALICRFAFATGIAKL